MISLVLDALGPNGVNEYVIPIIRGGAWVITNLLELEGLLRHSHETEVSPSPSLEAEVAHRIRTQKALERHNEERKCGLKVDAVGGEDHVGLCWQVLRNGLPPVQY